MTRRRSSGGPDPCPSRQLRRWWRSGSPSRTWTAAGNPFLFRQPSALGSGPSDARQRVLPRLALMGCSRALICPRGAGHGRAAAGVRGALRHAKVRPAAGLRGQVLVPGAVASSAGPGSAMNVSWDVQPWTSTSTTRAGQNNLRRLALTSSKLAVHSSLLFTTSAVPRCRDSSLSPRSTSRWWSRRSRTSLPTLPRSSDSATSTVPRRSSTRSTCSFAAVKRAAAQRYYADRGAYVEEKTPIVAELLEEARWSQPDTRRPGRLIGDRFSTSADDSSAG